MIKKVILSILICILLCISSLYLVTFMIPKSYIEDNIKESAEYLSNQELFRDIITDKVNTKQDNYADSILLNIIFNLDSSNSFKSILESKYYYEEGKEENDNLLKSVTENVKPTKTYSRYWHGSIIFLRPLLCFFNLQEIRLILFITTILLLLISFINLIKKKLYSYVFCFIVSLVIINTWVISYSLEYVFMYLLMSIILIPVMIFKDNKLILIKLFSISGVLACFIDFLTTETLVLTIPLLTLIVIKEKENNIRSIKEELKDILLFCFLFVISYSLTFITKLTLIYTKLGKQEIKLALNSVIERSIGSVNLSNSNLSPKATSFQKIYLGIIRNFGCLFQYKSNVSSITIVSTIVLILIIIFSIIYLFHSNSLYKELGVLMIIISLIPIIRFIVLSNHSYIHYFFTYRALLVLVISLLYYTVKCCINKFKWRYRWK